MKNTVALILVTSTLFLVGCCTTQHTTKWEYKQLSTSMVTDQTLNHLGDQGWDVVGYSSAPGAANGFYILKRPKH